MAVSVVPVLATSHFRLSVACSDRRKAFGVLVIFRVYHAYCILLYTRLLHCMKNTPFLLVKYASQPLLEKDKPLLFSCDFLFCTSTRDPLILPHSRSCQVCRARDGAWDAAQRHARVFAFVKKGRRRERVPRSLAVLAPLRSSLALARMAANG